MGPPLFAFWHMMLISSALKLKGKIPLFRDSSYALHNPNRWNSILSVQAKDKEFHFPLGVFPFISFFEEPNGSTQSCETER